MVALPPGHGEIGATVETGDRVCQFLQSERARGEVSGDFDRVGTGVVADRVNITGRAVAVGQRNVDCGVPVRVATFEGGNRQGLAARVERQRAGGLDIEVEVGNTLLRIGGLDGEVDVAFADLGGGGLTLEDGGARGADSRVAERDGTGRV